jgi:hypothetical protein
MKTTQKQQAKDLFFGTIKSRKEIAHQLNIDEKTLYLWIKKEAWDENKKAAHAAPAIIVDNLCYMLVELQTYISERPVGLRFPTPQEVDTMRKLINSITKMREYTSVGANMEMMVDFTNYISADQQFCTQLQAYAETYFKGRKSNARYTNNFGFGAQAPIATEKELNEIRENMLADNQETSNFDHTYNCEIDQANHQDTIIAATEITGSNFPDKLPLPLFSAQVILTINTPETLINKAFYTQNATPQLLPASGKIGNTLSKMPIHNKRPTFLKRHRANTQTVIDTNLTAHKEVIIAA